MYIARLLKNYYMFVVIEVSVAEAGTIEVITLCYYTKELVKADLKQRNAQNGTSILNSVYSKTVFKMNLNESVEF